MPSWRLTGQDALEQRVATEAWAGVTLDDVHRNLRVASFRLKEGTTSPSLQSQTCSGLKVCFNGEEVTHKLQEQDVLGPGRGKTGLQPRIYTVSWCVADPAFMLSKIDRPQCSTARLKYSIHPGIQIASEASSQS